MGSYCSLRVGHLSISEDKSEFNPYLMALFQDNEKVVIPNSQDEWTKAIETDYEIAEMESFEFKYKSSLGAMRDRLSVVGISDELVRFAFEAARLEKMKTLRREDSIQPLKELYDREHAILADFEFDQWCSDVRLIHENKLQAQFRDEDFAQDLPGRIRYMLHYPRSEMLGLPFDDYNVAMRAMSIALPAETLVEYDLTELAISGYLTVDVPWVEVARSQLGHSHELAQKIIVLTEGKSDRFAIEEALSILRPSIKDFYSFMDFDGFRVPGGASALITSLKALVGAGVVNRIIAVFDNDTAAHSSLRALRTVSLPGNVRVLHLPDTPLCVDYPTIGPSGMLPMNINGLASSIELFFGSDVLKSDQAFTPIQWRGYDESLRQYQGEIMHKDELFEKFRTKVNLAKSDPAVLMHQDWSSMQQLVEMLMLAFNGSYLPAPHIQ